eukprot:CAMPEP_0117451148 /NCGR_PEP_ID=MMETSP0759-20121206/8853_1 /TAXON_ID=63605 /ORGANISM="Percolomonas cosmopolitus, Strain WS" /LENGTH=147 /DNA_ID=CAMNT_0005243729 /DNA_START=63 /DNA_END=506 /DNA_ORIENTATION=-
MAKATTKVSKRREKEVLQAIKKGKRPRTRKVHHSATFTLPKQRVVPKNPKYARRSIDKRRALDKFAVLVRPVTSDRAVRLMENTNTLVFITHLKAHKKQIKRAFSDMYQVKIERVNTLITPRGEKKAFIKVNKDTPAIDIASKIGIC